MQTSSAIVKRSNLSQLHYGIEVGHDYTDILVNNSSISKTTSWALYKHFSDNSSGDSLRFVESIITDCNAGIHFNHYNSKAYIYKSKIIRSGQAMEFARRDPTIYVGRSLIKDGGTPISAYLNNVQNGSRFGGSVLFEYSTITGNSGYMRFGSDDEGPSTITYNNCVIKNDLNTEIWYIANTLNLNYCALEYGESAIYIGNTSYGSHAHNNLVTDNIYDTDEEGRLDPLSSAVDAGPANEMDGYMPPGLGNVRADLGMYGGPGNTIWGGSEIPDGEPEISQVVDLQMTRVEALVFNTLEVFLITDTQDMILRATPFGEIWMFRV